MDNSSASVTKEFQPRAWEVKVYGRVPIFFTSKHQAEQYHTVQKKEYPNLTNDLLPLYHGSTILTLAEQEHIKLALDLYLRISTKDTEDGRVLNPLRSRDKSIKEKLITMT